MTDAEIIAEIRRRVEQTKIQEQATISVWKKDVPKWSTYFQGYRDALGELIEMFQEGGKNDAK